jgi:hypothetical protein
MESWCAIVILFAVSEDDALSSSSDASASIATRWMVLSVLAFIAVAQSCTVQGFVMIM